jgi:hypothetical protein
MQKALAAKSPAPLASTQSLQRCLQLNLVPELEAIGDGFHRAIDPEGNRLESTVDNTLRKTGSTEPHESKWKGIDLWKTSLLADRHQDFLRRRGGESMKPECRMKTDHAMRHSKARFCKEVPVGTLASAHGIEAAAASLDQALLHRSHQELAISRVARDVAGSYDPATLDDADESSGSRFVRLTRVLGAHPNKIAQAGGSKQHPRNKTSVLVRPLYSDSCTIVAQ